MKQRGRELVADANVDGELMVTDMLYAINNPYEKIETDQEGVHGKPIIEIEQVQILYQTPRFFAGIAI